MPLSRGQVNGGSRRVDHHDPGVEGLTLATDRFRGSDIADIEHDVVGSRFEPRLDRAIAHTTKEEMVAPLLKHNGNLDVGCPVHICHARHPIDISDAVPLSMQKCTPAHVGLEVRIRPSAAEEFAAERTVGRGFVGNPNCLLSKLEIDRRALHGGRPGSPDDRLRDGIGLKRGAPGFTDRRKHQPVAQDDLLLDGGQLG